MTAFLAGESACQVQTHGRKSASLKWTGAGVVDRARLESVCAGNGTEGSNPSLSAIMIQMGTRGRIFATP